MGGEPLHWGEGLRESDCKSDRAAFDKQNALRYIPMYAMRVAALDKLNALRCIPISHKSHHDPTVVVGALLTQGDFTLSVR